MRALKREYLSVVELDFHGEEEEDGHEDRREAKGGLLLHRGSWERLSELGFLISSALFWFFLLMRRLWRETQRAAADMRAICVWAL